jgi:tetratricopeptide (TPR) repeat protein
LGFDIHLALSGRVLLENRQPSPEPVPVEYSCRGASLGALTDAKGRFSIVIGQQQVARTSLTNALPALEGCRIQVRIPGFEEILVTLKRPRALGDLNVGDLPLKSAGLQGNAVFSESGRNAPGKARQNYVRSLEALNAGRLPEALAFLDKAIAAYPQYAAALQVKGYVLELMGQREPAHQAYGQAVAADPAYAKPLVQLADMAAEDQNAAEAARWVGMANRLAPGAFPGVYLTEGSAYFNLGRFDDAEKAARAGLDADPQCIYPGLRRLMGEVLYQKRSYAAALEQFERYVKEAPEALDLGSIQERVESSKRLAAVNIK